MIGESKHWKEGFLNELVAHIYREKFDSSSDIAALADDTWQKSKFEVEDGLHKGLYDGTHQTL